MSNKPAEPFQQLPKLPPRAELETKEILRQTILANKALAKLDGTARLLPNQSMLVSAIILQEAKISSEIESIVTTNDELYKALSSDLFAPNADTKEVLHYSEALWEGYSEVKKKGIITTNLCIRIFQIIKESGETIRKSTGTKIQNSTTKKVIYTPPEGEDIIRGLLRNWEDYLHAEGPPDPLIRMAVLHYQFEAIHPFSDGNGRTGRIINILYLVQQGLLELPILYLSKYIIENKKGYYNGLMAITEKGAWEPWVLYMLNAVTETAGYTQKKVEAIADLMKTMGEEMRNAHPEFYRKELSEALFLMPYTRRKILEAAMNISLKTAGSYLSRLEASGFLRSIRKGKEKLYLNYRLFDLLTA